MIKTFSDLETSKPPVLEDISVIIPTLGRDLLEGCLHSIANGDAWPKCIIIVDQGSSSQVTAWVEDLRSIGMGVHYIASSQRGVAAARNRGIESCKTKYFAITDDDCLVEKNWLVMISRSLENHPGAVVTGMVKPGGEGLGVSTKTSLQPMVYTQPLLKEDIFYPGNMGCPISVFSAVGSFDERAFLQVAEDNDWAYRALRSGIKIVYSPDVGVVHLDWRSGEALRATYRAYARSQGGFYGKYLRKGDLFILLRVVVSLVRAARRLLFGCIRRDQDAIANAWSVFTQLFPGIIAGLKEGS